MLTETPLDFHSMLVGDCRRESRRLVDLNSRMFNYLHSSPNDGRAANVDRGTGGKKVKDER
jgi:hypothetical protein